MNSKFILWGSLLEGGLVFLAMGLGWIVNVSHWGNLHWSLKDLFIGIGAAIPLLGIFFLTIKSSWSSLTKIREFLDEVIYPLIKNCNPLELAILSFFAGLGEEMLFRAVIQGALSNSYGIAVGLGVASLIFGMAHWITRTYVIIAGLIGVYLGSLWMWTGNLLVPITTHAVYDFLALLLFLKLKRG